MSRLFKIFAVNDPQAGGGENFCIGIPVKVAGRETVIPLSDPFHTFEGMASASKDIQDDLNLLRKEAERIFQAETMSEGETHFPPEMEPDKIWAILIEMDDEEAFVRAFNHIEPSKRGLVAEFVLTKCNIFSGRAAVFSARYDSATGLLE